MVVLGSCHNASTENPDPIQNLVYCNGPVAQFLKVLIQDVPMLLVLSVVILTLPSLQNFPAGRRPRPVICIIENAECSDMEFADELLSCFSPSPLICAPHRNWT